jgi:hypothetical protein
MGRNYRKWPWAQIGKGEMGGNYRFWLWAEIGKSDNGEWKKLPKAALGGNR